MQKEFEPYHVLLVHCHAGALFMTKDPINKVEDFQGMKLRSYSRTNSWILEALGAAPLQVALPELAPMLSKGTVTGSILPYEIAPSDVKLWFGIITLMVVEIGLITPPVCLNVFVINSLAKDVPMIDTFRGVFPFLMSDMIRLTLVVVFPMLSLILPKVIGG